MKTYTEYKFDSKTVIAGTPLDLEAEGKGRRVRYIEPVGASATIQGREKGKASAEIANFSTTGAYTGADAQAAVLNEQRLVNYDKVFVATGSAPVRCLICNDEMI